VTQAIRLGTSGAGTVKPSERIQATASLSLSNDRAATSCAPHRMRTTQQNRRSGLVGWRARRTSGAWDEKRGGAAEECRRIDYDCRANDYKRNRVQNPAKGSEVAAWNCLREQALRGRMARWKAKRLVIKFTTALRGRNHLKELFPRSFRPLPPGRGARSAQGTLRPIRRPRPDRLRKLLRQR
jgi:hypothetical protein